VLNVTNDPSKIVLELDDGAVKIIFVEVSAPLVNDKCSLVPTTMDPVLIKSTN